MGWFPIGLFLASPEKRIARAKAMMAQFEYNDARMELEGLDHPEAAGLRARALEALVEMNLLEWMSQRGAGNTALAGAALARAKQFGASKEQIAGFVPRAGTETFSASHRLRK